MKSFIRVFISLNLVLLFLSCSNLIQIPTTDLTFSLGERVSNDILAKFPEKSALTEETPITIETSFLGLKLNSQSISVPKNKLADARLFINNIPLNTEFKILVKVYFGEIVIYQAESNPVKLTKENDKQEISIVLQEKRGKITYLGLNGVDALNSSLKEDYYIDTPEWTLEEPTKSGYNFFGWYTKDNEKIEKLGGSNPYVGDIVLTAKWGKITPIKEITNNKENLSFGTNGVYVTFGYYPQSVKEGGVQINDTTVEQYKGYDCYKGNDNCYYVKVDNPAPCGNTYSYQFYKNTEPIKPNKTYFKIEPVKWRVLDFNFKDESGQDKGVLLLAEDILYAGAFSESLNNESKNNYNISNLKINLSNMANKMFDENELKYIQNIQISAFSTTTEDNKLFPLKSAEIYNKYGFPDENAFIGVNTFIGNREIIVRRATDYARANGAFVDKGVEHFSWWWTREKDPYNTVNTYIIQPNGKVKNSETCGNSGGGILPAVVVSSEIKDTIPHNLKYVKNIKGHTEKDGILISWDKNDSAYVKVSDGKTTKTVSQGETSCKFNYSTIKEGTEYTYTVTPYDNTNTPGVSETYKIIAGIGYVIMKDGSKESLSSAVGVPEDAVAFIYGVHPDTKKLLGLGLNCALRNGSHDSNGGKEWSANNVAIDNIKCEVSDKNGRYVSGDKDGSDNWEKIKTADTAYIGKYPAFEYAESYGSNLPNAIEELKIGWYIPTVYEIGQIYEKISYINDALTKLNKQNLKDWYLWSSNTVAGDNTKAYQVPLAGDNPCAAVPEAKTQKNTVRCIRQF